MPTLEILNPPRRHYYAFVALFLVGLGCGGSFPPSPTLDANAISTIIAGTSLASNLETLSVPSPTAVIENILPLLPADTQTASPAATDTQAPFSIPVTGAACIPNNPPQTGTVLDIVDGDTIKVLLDQDGLTYTVRYIGMDTPENTSQVEYFGAQATAKNAELVAGKAVTLFKDVSETDRFGRLLRYVLTDTVFVNYELVAQGYANTASFPPDVACIPTFQSAEQQAAALSLGLWAAPPTLVVVNTQPPSVPPTSIPSGGGNAPCSCSSNAYNCPDFNSHSSAQACFDYCLSVGRGDIHRLDADNDGSACDNLP